MLGSLCLFPVRTLLAYGVKVLRYNQAKYGKEAWKNFKVTKYLSKWTGHPSAACYTAPGLDGGIELPYPEWYDYDNQLTSLQNSVGGIAAILTRILGLFEERNLDLKGKVEKFRDSQHPHDQPQRTG